MELNRQAVWLLPFVYWDINGYMFYTDGAHIGQHGKVLVHSILQVGFGNLVSEDVISLAQQSQLVLGYFSDNPKPSTQT